MHWLAIRLRSAGSQYHSDAGRASGLFLGRYGNSFRGRTVLEARISDVVVGRCSSIRLLELQSIPEYLISHQSE
jgi:hypothetical protein